MHFLFPWMLLGTLGISVPIVIHLFNRYRFRQVEWGAMELLRRAVIVRARRIRLEDVLLLLLRCLVILLIALALARPVLRSRGGAWLGKSASVGAVVAVDASFSMGHRPGVQSRFDQACDRAREAAKTLPHGSPMTLVLLGDRPRVLLRNVGHDPDRFEAALKEARPLPERLNLEICLEEIETLTKELSAPVKECYLITDAQASTWNPVSDKARQSLHDLGTEYRVFFLTVPAGQWENLAVTRFELKSGLLRKGAAARYDVEVGNYGAHRRENVTVGLLLDDVTVDQRVLDRLEPGQKTTVPLFARFDKVGSARLTARLGPDELLEDNTRYAVAGIHDKTRILYVRAASGDAASRDDKDFILTALTPRPTEALSVDAVSWLDLPSRRLGDYQIVILANVPDLADELVRNLAYFVKEGGGLIVFLGDNVQPALYNARMQYEATPLLPAELAEAVADSAGWPIETLAHPLARVLGTVPDEMVREARVYRYFRLRLGEGGRAVLKLAGRNDPVIAEKALGRGKVILFAGAAERSWTNMVVEPGFYPLLLHEAVTYLGRQAHEQPFTVSQALAVPLPVKEDAAVKSVIFQPQGGAPKSVTPVKRDGQTYAELAGAEQPGFYEIRTEPPTTALYTAVNVDPRESNVQPLPESALAETFKGLNLRMVIEGDELGSAVHESRIGRELWKELLIASLLVLLVEGFLALWFTRRASAAREAQATPALARHAGSTPAPLVPV